MPIAFVGDVHGCSRELRDLLAKIDSSIDHIVFLGDLVNRGPDSKGVLEIIAALRSSNASTVTLLAGNHDLQLRQVLEDDDALDEFLRMGGAATIRSYVGPPYEDVLTQLRVAIPVSHRLLLDNLETTWEGDGVTAVHDARSLGHNSSGFVVAGHSAQRMLVPTIRSNYALIDTGCGTIRGGRLTCMYWPTQEWFQSSIFGP